MLDTSSLNSALPRLGARSLCTYFTNQVLKNCEIKFLFFEEFLPFLVFNFKYFKIFRSVFAGVDKRFLSAIINVQAVG